MPQIVPVEPSIPHYDLTTEVDGHEYVFDVRWNARDEAWYLSAFEADGAPIFQGAKIVLGTYIARWCRHRLTTAGALIAIDLTNQGVDATFDDLGTRVVLTHWTNYEIASAVRAFAASLRAA